MSWFGHVERMDERRLTNEIYRKARSKVPETGESVWGIRRPCFTKMI
jgi:hypothetical protein